MRGIRRGKIRQVWPARTRRIASPHRASRAFAMCKRSPVAVRKGALQAAGPSSVATSRPSAELCPQAQWRREVQPVAFCASCGLGSVVEALHHTCLRAEFGYPPGVGGQVVVPRWARGCGHWLRHTRRCSPSRRGSRPVAGVCGRPVLAPVAVPGQLGVLEPGVGDLVIAGAEFLDDRAVERPVSLGVGISWLAGTRASRWPV